MMDSSTGPTRAPIPSAAEAPSREASEASPADAGVAQGVGRSARVVARNTMLQAAGDTVGKIASLAFYVVMARTIGRSGFGDFTFAAVVIVFVELGGAGTDPVLTREVSRRLGAVHDLFWNALLVKLALGGAIAVIAVSVVAAVGYPAHVVAALAILAAAGLAELIAKTVHATFQGVEDMAPAARGLALQRITTALIGIAALLAGAGVVVAALTYLAGALVALAYVSAGLLRRVARPLLNVSLRAARRLLASSWPVGATVVLGAAVARLDVVLLSALKDNVAVGLYSAAFRPYEALYFLSWSFGLAALPALSRLTRNSEPPLRRAFEVGMKVMALALFPVGCMFALFAETILTTLYGDAYATAAPALRLLGVSIALSGLGTLATQLLVSQERVKVTLPVSVAALGVNAGLNLLLIPPYSFEGAAAAMAATTLTFSGLLVALAVRVAGHPQWHRVLASPVGACLAMAIVVLGLGTGVPALIVAFAVATPIAVLIERRLFPDDYRLLRHSLSVRHARERTAV